MSKLRAVLLAASVMGVFLFATAGNASAVGEITVSNAAPTPGTAITVTSTGWSAGRDVTIAVSGSERPLARVAADASGSVHARVTIPNNVSLDFNFLSVTGTAAAGVPQQIVTPLAVHLGHAPAPTRPWVPVLLLLAVAAALLVMSLTTTKPAARLAAG